MAVEMTDSHRRFLQILMSHGIMEGSEVRALHRHCCEAHKVYYAHDKLDDFLSVINTQLHPLFMQIRKGLSEDDGRSHYALVNLAETEVTKMSTDYAENELELFRKTMDLIILSDNGLVSSTNVLNLVDQLQSKKMKKKEAEQVLQTFVQDKWLFEKEGEYTLSTRCIMEMDHYIRNAYQDVVGMCNICHSIVIQRQTCETCGIQMHFPCVAKYFRGQPEPHCPNCNGFWPHEIPDIDRSDSPQRSQQPSTSQREPSTSQREPSTSQMERRGAIPASALRKTSRR